MKFYVKLDAFKTGIYSLACKLIWFSGQRKQSELCTYFVQELIFWDLLTLGTTCLQNYFYFLELFYLH